MGYGTLFICGTPIGNLEDISLRVLRTLKEADIIAAEDTRHTRKLLSHYDIKKPMLAYHEHNKGEGGRRLVEMLKNGKSVALVTDGGMPCVSDPGEDIARLCVSLEIPLTVCPGPTAAITALAMSGLPTSRFVFEGFLPRGGAERREILAELAMERRTLIFYEAPHRIKETLSEIYLTFGDRRAALLRELTKMYEDSLRGGLSELIEHFLTNEPKGEYVLVVSGADDEEIKKRHQIQYEGVSYTNHLEHYTSKGMDKKEAMKAVAKDRGLSKRVVYDELLAEKAGYDTI